MAEFIAPGPRQQYFFAKQGFLTLKIVLAK